MVAKITNVLQINDGLPLFIRLKTLPSLLSKVFLDPLERTDKPMLRICTIGT